MPGSGPVRRAARVGGRVQGVGFRPAVARFAAGLGLAGAVRNAGGGVELDVEGPTDRVEAFVAGLAAALPPGARPDPIRWEARPPLGRAGFRIERSTGGDLADGPPPDVVSCPACLAEVRGSGRRRGYAFTSCADCGPRFTITRGLPWDRANTTMSAFPMCEDCRAEYADPGDRRFHAQTLACPACGPRLWFAPGPALDPLRAAQVALRAGRIVAVKGLGGWQLLVDATSAAAVGRLRERKRRDRKPFAVLVADVAAARALARLADGEDEALGGAAGPIVLVRSRGSVAPAVAPGLARIGLMLPPTPLHHLLVDGLPFPVVCTSGNRAGEPQAIDDDEARERLAGLADAWLGHDRPIAFRCDDAVVHVVDGEPRALRLGRGLAPATLRLPPGPDGVALGGHQRCAPAAAAGERAVLWPHVGDLDGPRGRRALAEAMAALAALSPPTFVAHDAHPDSGAARVAEGSPLPRRPVFHHHAHVGAVLAELGWDGALGFAWDGFGLGPDGTAWGGEVLRVDAAGATRVARLRPFPLPGGDAAARDGRRAAAGLLVAAGLPVPTAWGALAAVARAAPHTTSVGRLFDGVAALLGVRERSAFEGEAALALEDLAGPGADPWPVPLAGGELDWRPLVAGVLALRDDPATAASRLHATLVEAICALAAGAPRVVLAGGCFQNRLLAEGALARLRGAGIEARLPARIPPGDGGLAAGQLWVARAGRG